MTSLRNFVEPVAITVIFTLGALISRRRRRRRRSGYYADSTTSVYAREAALVSQSQAFLPDNSTFQSNSTSQVLAKFPFLVEIWYWNLTYWMYQLARAYSAYRVRGNESVFAVARAHALHILSLEEKWGINVELRLQSYILECQPILVPILAKIYYSHIVVGVIFIVYAFTTLPPALFQSIRRTIAIDNLIALVMISSWRCMPPRLLPPEYGFTDILHSGPQSAWTHNRFQLTIAAMPSLHFGTALFIGICLSRFSPHRWVRWLAPLWPVAMLVTIIATANHFILDAAIGALVPALGWRLNGLMLLLRPLEEWLFWLCRTERPTMDEEQEPRSPRIKPGDWSA